MSELSRSERSERTREKLLAAGLEILREEPADLVFDRLDARAVATKSGVTSGAFYHHFDGADGYVEALLQYSLLVDKSRPFGVASPVFEAKVLAGASFVEAFIAGAIEMVRFQDQNHTFTLQVAVWAKRARSVDITKRLKQMYRNVDEETGGYYQDMLTALGREMRPPYEAVDLAGAFTALFEGLTLRRGVDPDAMPDSRLGELLVPLLTMMTRPIGDEVETEAWLAASGLDWAPDGAPSHDVVP